MSTIIQTKSSLTVNRGGTLSFSTSGTTTLFTTGANEYAEVSITGYVSAQTSNQTASVTAQNGAVAFITATATYGTAPVTTNIGVNSSTPVTFKVPPSTAFSIVRSISAFGGVIACVATYTVFTNS